MLDFKFTLVSEIKFGLLVCHAASQFNLNSPQAVILHSEFTYMKVVKRSRVLYEEDQ